MPYDILNTFPDKYDVVDLRSDTISKPTEEMREAMKNAVVGDDVYNEDPTVKELESRSAKLLGKECGLFLPTGTMANLVASTLYKMFFLRFLKFFFSVMVHCASRGSEIIMGDMSHTFRFEQGNGL